MSEILQELGLSLDEREDFDIHWEIKISYASQYCVYPQSNNELDKLVSINAKYKSKNQGKWEQLDQIRILFLIDLNPTIEQIEKIKPFDPKKLKSRDNKEVILREWGVA